MKVTVFSIHKFEKEFLEQALNGHELKYIDTRLNKNTASLAQGSDAVSIFVNDEASALVLEKLNALVAKSWPTILLEMRS